MKKPCLKTVKGYGWSGLWNDGTLGWRIGNYVSNYSEPLYADRGSDGGPYYRVEITVKVCRDKRGNPIIRHGATCGS